MRPRDREGDEQVKEERMRPWESGRETGTWRERGTETEREGKEETQGRRGNRKWARRGPGTATAGEMTETETEMQKDTERPGEGREELSGRK